MLHSSKHYAHHEFIHVKCIWEKYRCKYDSSWKSGGYNVTQDESKDDKAKGGRGLPPGCNIEDKDSTG